MTASRTKAAAAGERAAGREVRAEGEGARSLTPMLRHYLEVKAENPDAILLYRMGDFYETFFEDAEVAAPIFEIQLTARQRGTPSEAPMCGIPHHAVGAYVGKLLRAGHKVALCDQVEDPALAKGLVRREVTRVVTPGTVTELELLDSREPNYLAAVLWRDGQGAAAFLDISTGRFIARRWAGVEPALEDLARLVPREVISAGELPAELERAIDERVSSRSSIDAAMVAPPDAAAARLRRQLGVASLRAFGLDDAEPAVQAAATALSYAADAARSELEHVRTIELRSDDETMLLDETTLRNLEVFRTLREGRRRGSLLWAVDATVTAPGSRLLADWIGAPLRRAREIERRLDAVEELLGSAASRKELRDELEGVADLERATSRAVLGSLTPPEGAGLRAALDRVPEIFRRLERARASLLREIAGSDPLADLRRDLHQLLVEEPPASLKDGGVIAEGVDEELDRVRSLARDGKRHVLALEAREREATGIASLKVRYNRVFGYYIEVTRSNQKLVPDRYVRKQTLANAERYFTEELKTLEEQILGAEESQVRLEQEIWDRTRRTIAEAANRLRALASGLAALDVVAGWAELASRHDYRRPELAASGLALAIEAGRHPVVERTLRTPFVPNDLELDEAARIVLLTGPNMGGKSTYLRQAALLVVLAQAGCFVPAERATVPLFDRVFTRVGASDDLARGESTFMVEMLETAHILRHATSDSLVVLDEVGRGTATFDGLSLAWAIVEHLHRHNRCRTLFATHYHELTELAEILPGVRNRTMAVKEWQDRIVFLHRVVPGSADKSYGIQVARLAGLPPEVTTRAAEILANLEAQEYDVAGRPRLAQGAGAPPPPEADQLRLFARPEDVVAQVLRELDTDQLTPIAALNLLQTLRSRLS
ncbi:MAG TPA: DNA mismatch repair protein MutS [Thermoanaerobaculia bacterium]|nr:DNA mismatch repair protein MutS [Thermoanaerobaculia bacterium]